MSRLLGDGDALQKSLAQHAEILVSLCRLDEASALAEAREQLCREIGEGTARSEARVQNAQIQAMRDDLDLRAEPVTRRERSRHRFVAAWPWHAIGRRAA